MLQCFKIPFCVKNKENNDYKKKSKELKKMENLQKKQKKRIQQNKFQEIK